ncbi:MAG: pyridoxamine 5'-phosphate oxidase family protein [Lachnospiraceae bacterium]|nr:pyridoxamine 5'-phosphate oxidase family protein [Lachnospiraceae bacterium]
MRRKDREVVDFDKIVSMIDGFEVVRLGFADGDYPYIVPLTFGYEVVDKHIYIYVHGAMAGRKYELMQKNKKCSFEMDEALRMECLTEAKDVTMRYKSVMGTATIDLLEGEDRQRAIDDVIMARHEETKHFDYNRKKVPVTAVARLTVRNITAKVNPLGGGPD